MLASATEMHNVDWQVQPDYFGAFKLNRPGPDAAGKDAYFQFLSCVSANEPSVFFAGDSNSWAGGWTEGALHTGINAACAVAICCGLVVRPDSCLTQDPKLLRYGTVGTQRGLHSICAGVNRFPIAIRIRV